MFFRIFLLSIILVVALALNLCFGDVAIAPQHVWSILMHPTHEALNNSGFSDIIWQIRLPRLLAAFTAGSGLAIAGYVLQNLSRNNLADPFLTGTSSGAGLAVAIATIAGLDFTFIPLSAFIGGLTASILVALMARSPAGISVTKLLLSGVALSAICGSIITLVLIRSDNPVQAQSLFYWLAGGVAGRSWSELLPASIYVCLGVIATLILSKPLRLLSLGTQAAGALGLDVIKSQWALFSAAILTCGASVSVAGIVGFVGLIAPHLARNLFGRDERIHIVTAAIVGGILVLLSDLLARKAGGGQELPLSSLLALVGGPFFLWLIIQQKSEGT